MLEIEAAFIKAAGDGSREPEALPVFDTPSASGSKDEDEDDGSSGSWRYRQQRLQVMELQKGTSELLVQSRARSDKNSAVESASWVVSAWNWFVGCMKH